MIIAGNTKTALQKVAQSMRGILKRIPIDRSATVVFIQEPLKLWTELYLELSPNGGLELVFYYCDIILGLFLCMVFLIGLLTYPY